MIDYFCIKKKNKIIIIIKLRSFLVVYLFFIVCQLDFDCLGYDSVQTSLTPFNPSLDTGKQREQHMTDLPPI